MADFRLAASSAAAPASRAEELKYKAASVCLTVTCHVSGFPDCNGTKVRPSGHLPSDLNNPTGSLVTGMLADAKALIIIIIIIITRVGLNKNQMQPAYGENDALTTEPWLLPTAPFILQ